MTVFGSHCTAGQEGVPDSLDLPKVGGNLVYVSGTVASYHLGPFGCRSCDPGGYAASPYEHQCSLCRAGKFLGFPGAASGANCTNCTAGTYAASAGSPSCTSCDAGRYSITPAADSHFVCANCVLGSYSASASTACTVCGGGKHSSFDRSDCDDCEAGKYSGNGADECTACDLGSYSASSSFECPLCGSGKRSSFDRSDCDDCEAGKYSGDGAHKCEACPIGKSSPSSSSACECALPFVPLGGTCACSAGYSFDGLSSCESCENGYFKETASNDPCAACSSVLAGSLATKAGELASSPFSCICGSGEVLSNNNCEPCPEGGVCEELGLTLETMPIKPTYWRTSNTSIAVLKCSNEGACTPSENSNSLCKVHHAGPFCESCEPGFALSAGICVSCEGGTAGSIAVVVIVALLLAAAGSCCYSIRGSESVSRSASGVQQVVSDLQEQAVSKGSLFVNRFKLPAKLLLQYYQIISMLSAALDLPFPTAMSATTNAASASNLDIIALVPTGCAVETNLHDKLLTFSVGITVAGMVVGAVRKSSFFKAYLIGLSFVLPSVTRLIFTTFPCVELDTGERWLVADKNIDCDGAGERANAATRRFYL